MARKKVPVVGSAQLHPVQISPELRKLEAKRTRKAAHRAYSPVLAADRGEFGATNKEYRNEAASARGATNAVENTLAQALAGLKGAGLTGTALQQTKSEFTSRAADAASSLPSLLAGAQEERAKGLATDRQALTQDRASMLQSGAEAFNQRLKELRGAGATQLKEQEDRQRSHGETTEKATKKLAKEVSDALHEANRLFAAYPTELPSNSEEWAKFTGQLEKLEGVSGPAAMTATRIIRKQHDELLHRGKLPQPGVPPPR